MRLEAIKGHFVDGEPKAVGTVYEVPDKLALELIAIGKARAAEQAAPTPKVKPKGRPRKIMTTEDFGDNDAE